MNISKKTQEMVLTAIFSAIIIDKEYWPLQ